MSVRKDTQYLSVSSRVRAMENRLVTRDRLERMIDAADDAQALKVLAECGYGEITDPSPAALETALRAGQTEVLRELGSIVPDARILDVFRLKTDYHNLKVLLKSALTEQSADRLLLPGGRYAPELLSAAFAHGDLRDCAPAFRQAAEQAGQILADTRDARAADAALDRAYFAELSSLADLMDSELLRTYARLAADAANLRTCVRCARLGKDAAFLADALVEGGSVPVSTLVRTAGRDPAAPFRSGMLSEAAELAADLAKPGGAPMTAFERACDDALASCFSRCRRVPFGEEVVLGYLFAREAEQTAIRTVMAGRRAGLDGEIIRQRLRACYV